jgi:signal transduction histidine kinase
MYKIKSLVILIFALAPLLIFSQEKSVEKIINDEMIKKGDEFKHEFNFIKSQFFFNKKNWDSTLVYSMKQLSLSSSKNKELADYCHYFRGYSFLSKGLYNEAKKELLLVSNTFAFNYLKYISLANASLELKEFEKAIHYYKEADKLYQTTNQIYDISKVYEGLGKSYIFINKFNIAEKYLFKSLTIKNKEKDKVGLFHINNNIANLYYQQYKDKLAIIFFKKAYLISQKTSDLSAKTLASENMAIVEENSGNYKKALIYRKESEQWKDSLNDQNKVWAVADFEKKYAVAQKQKKIKVLEIENKLKATQRNSLFYSLIGLLLLLVIGVYFYAQKMKNEKTILLQKNKLDELNTTKDQLFSIVSHDLRSSVNALKTSNTKLMRSLENKNYNALDQLLHNNSSIANGAYNLLDNLLHWALLQTKQLYFHKESIHLYSIVQQIEYNYKPLFNDKKIIFENTVFKSDFIYADLDSLKIILRNFLDNAIKFTSKNGKITIYTKETNNEFCQLIIEDTGIGMNQNTISELLKDTELLSKKSNDEIIGTGLGMQLCKQMIKKNNGILAIESEINKGTKMLLLLPKTK